MFLVSTKKKKLYLVATKIIVTFSPTFNFVNIFSLLRLLIALRSIIKALKNTTKNNEGLKELTEENIRTKSE